MGIPHPDFLMTLGNVHYRYCYVIYYSQSINVILRIIRLIYFVTAWLLE